MVCTHTAGPSTKQKSWKAQCPSSWALEYGLKTPCVSPLGRLLHRINNRIPFFPKAMALDCLTEFHWSSVESVLEIPISRSGNPVTYRSGVCTSSPHDAIGG